MAQEGFEYVGPPYAGINDLSNLAYFRLTSADESGYNGTFEALRGATPIGEPQDNLPFDQIDEYTVALRGSSDPETARVGGCYAQAELALEGLDIVDPDDGRSFGSFAESLLASPTYEVYSDEWTRCLLEAGVEPRSSDVLRHTSIAHDHYYAEGFRVLSLQPPESALFRSLRNPPPLLDSEWLHDQVANHAALEQLLVDELAEAEVDAACRAGLGDLEAELLSS